MRALKSVSAGRAEIQTVSLPTLRNTYILVHVHSVALNPTDWKHIDSLAAPGSTVGCDLSGEVVGIGKGVTKQFSIGDKVAGFAHGVHRTEKEYGAFAEYALIKADIAIPIPKTLSMQEAATLGVGVTTVGQALYQSLRLPLPDTVNCTGEWLLVYGGSTATGILAIQYAKLSGMKVISTNSPRHNEFVEDLGAGQAFDYNDPECGRMIRDFTKGRLSYAFDCISETDSASICCDAIGPIGGKISFLMPVDELPRKDIENVRTLAYTINGEAFPLGEDHLPAEPEDLKFGKDFWTLSYKLLSEGKVKVHPVDARPGGLDSVLGGLDDLRQGRVSGKKIVYSIVE